MCGLSTADASHGFYRRSFVVSVMPREFISEYGLDPGDYIQRLVNQFCECCPKFSEQTVEEAIFVDGG